MTGPTVADPTLAGSAPEAEKGRDLVVVTGHVPAPDGGGGSTTTSPLCWAGGAWTAVGALPRGGTGVWLTASHAGEDGAERRVLEGTPAPPAPLPFEIASVPLSPTEIAGYDAGMADATLWRLFHGAVTQPQYRRAWWDTYVSVNRRFAQEAGRRAAACGIVWVQGFRLQLVPAILRSLRPDLTIGFTSRLPFPPFELFAQLPWRRELLRGLSGADLIGLPRVSDVENLLAAAQRCGPGTRLTPVARRASGRSLGRRGRAAHRARVIAFPAGVNARALDRAARDRRTVTRSRLLREALGAPGTVLLGVDPLDDTRGIINRLDAVAALFAQGRLNASDTVVVQIAIPSRYDGSRRLREHVERTVARINGTYASLAQPAVHYLHRTLPPRELAALYLAADVLLTTPLSDGTSVVAQEYIASQHDGRGAVVASEFTGTAEEFPEALIVNPHDPEAVQNAILRAASLPAEEAGRRMHAMRRRLFDRDAAQAVAEFLDELAVARAPRAAARTRS